MARDPDHRRGENISSPATDPANGYDAHAAEFIARRSRSGIGAATVAAWARDLPRGAVVLDLGCGDGQPITDVLVEAGASVYGIDASPAMVAAFRERHPLAPVQCGTAETSDFFGRRFDAVVAWGLLFLLAPEAQRAVIHGVASALEPTGEFLFTAPAQVCTWTDVLTGCRSESLGAAAYGRELEASGLTLVRELRDEGDNHYYIARKLPMAGEP